MRRNVRSWRWLLPTFGLYLPFCCFLLDHVMHLHVYGGATTMARVFVAGELGAFALWWWKPPSSPLVSCALAGAFLVGASFSLATALALLPTSLIGVLILIGAFGLVPFGTAGVYFSAAVRAIEGSIERVSMSAAFAILAGGVASMVPAALVRAGEHVIGERVVRAIESGTPEALDRAREELAHLPRCDVEDLIGLFDEYPTLLPGDARQWHERSWIEEVSSFPVGYD